MTYNILNDHPKFKDKPSLNWENRKEKVIEHILYHQPTILAIQEGKINQIEAIQKATSLAYYGQSAGGAYGGEQAGIFYRADLFEVLGQDTFWLSRTPEQPSMAWGAGHHRICSYLVLQLKATKAIYILLNTHLDAKSKIARSNSLQLIFDRIKGLKQIYPTAQFILTGDLNSGTHTAVYQSLKQSVMLKDTFIKAIQRKNSLKYTFCGIDKAWTWTKLLLHLFYPNYMHQRIDHIFVSPTIKVATYEISDWSYGRYYPSDHFPVVAELDL